MTWKEFKDYVEQHSIRDDDTIVLIDTTGVDEVTNLEIERHNDEVRIY